MSIVVYSISGAPRCWRVLTGLVLKGVDFETRYLEASEAEHKSPEYLCTNPRGKVPAIDAGGFILRDSTAILAWLERAYPDRPIFGATPGEAAAIWLQCMEAEEYLRSAAQKLLFPLLVQQQSLARISTEQQETMRAAGSAMHEELGRLEKLLVGQPFLVGDQATAAEAFVYPETRLLYRAIERKPDDMSALGFEDTPDRYPLLFKWMARVQSLPGMNRTEPRHWN